MDHSQQADEAAVATKRAEMLAAVQRQRVDCSEAACLAVQRQRVQAATATACCRQQLRAALLAAAEKAEAARKTRFEDASAVLETMGAATKQDDEGGAGRMAALLQANAIWKKSFDEAKTLSPKP